MSSLSKMPLAEQWADRIGTQMGKSVEAIIEVGRLLIKAKAELAHGEWGRMFDDKLLPMSQRTAIRLIQIANHPVLSDRSHGTNLPPSWRTLYELSHLKPAELNAAFKDGLISPEMPRTAVAALRPVRVKTVEAEVITQEPAPKRHKHHDEIVRRLRAGETVTGIAAALKVGNDRVSAIGVESGLLPDRTAAALAARNDRMRQMAADGHTSRQIAVEVGLGIEGCRLRLRELGIDVPADKVAGRNMLPNANRIIESIVMDAENLTADVGLIDFDSLDRERIREWLKALNGARESLGGLIRRLNKEQQRNVEAA